MTAGHETIPLFPLDTVVYPGGRLSLRIFEPRYLDMVRDCARQGEGFGVVYSRAGESGRGGEHARVGTEAVMIDFDTLDDGLLGVTCRGARRFRIRQTRTRDNGLLVGEIDWLAPEPAVPVPARFGALQTLLRELILNGQTEDSGELDPDNATSLGFALAAALVPAADHGQALLEMTDPIARLEALVALLQKS